MWLIQRPIARLLPQARASFAKLALLLVVGGCVRAAPPAVPLPAADGARLADSLERATRLERPSLYRFDWNMSEQGARMSGRGVARAEPPYRARLDLFTGGGETVARAALIDGELYLPAEVPGEIIPPPSLLWAALGVFRPGPDALLLSAQRSGDTVELRYRAGGGEELRYHIEGDRVRAVELLRDGHAVHRMTLIPEESERHPKDATYRNLAAFRELKLVTRSVENVESYPPETWLPHR
jgi:hypothetical protein